MLTKLIVYAAYYLKSSEAYKNSKLFFYNLLENPSSTSKPYFDMFMTGLIVLSIFFLLYDVEHEASAMGGYIEQAILVVFACEYLLRFWIYSDTHIIILEEHEKSQYLNIEFSFYKALKKAIAKKIEYIFSPFAIIDCPKSPWVIVSFFIGLWYCKSWSPLTGIQVVPPPVWSPITSNELVSVELLITAPVE